MTTEMIQTLYKFGQFQYSCGNYGGAADMLYHYRVLVCFHGRPLHLDLALLLTL